MNEQPGMQRSDPVDAAPRLRDGLERYSPKRSSSGVITLQNGWIVGQNGELLLWIPPAHREPVLVPGPQ